MSPAGEQLHSETILVHRKRYAAFEDGHVAWGGAVVNGHLGLCGTFEIPCSAAALVRVPMSSSNLSFVSSVVLQNVQIPVIICPSGLQKNGLFPSSVAES